jgi:3-dehydroquinate dehydratase-2
MVKPIHILNGPNLNLLGMREPHIYGTATLADVEAACRAAAGATPVFFAQTNHEGVLVDWLHAARAEAGAIILNAGALTHTSIAIHDALKAIAAPVIEVHLSNPAKREPFRHVSHVATAATGGVFGFGLHSYVLAVQAALHLTAATATDAP